MTPAHIIPTRTASGSATAKSNRLTNAFISEITEDKERRRVTVTPKGGQPHTYEKAFTARVPSAYGRQPDMVGVYSYEP